MELCQSKNSVIDSASDKEVFHRLSELKLEEHGDCEYCDGSKIGVDTFDTAVTQLQYYDVKRPKLRGKQEKQKEIPKVRGMKKPTVAADYSKGSKISAATAHTAKKTKQKYIPKLREKKPTVSAADYSKGSKIAAATAHTANQLCDEPRKLTAKQKKQIKTPKLKRFTKPDSDCSEDDCDFTAPKVVDKKTGNHIEPDRWLTAVERAKYERQVKESGGFDVDCFPATYDGDLIRPVFVFSGSENQEWDHKSYKRLANLAIQDYNYAHQDSKIELSRVLKANFKHDYPAPFYITFEARNAAADNDGAQIGNIFQALVTTKYGADETVVFCRPKPTPPQSSSSNSS